MMFSSSTLTARILTAAATWAVLLTTPSGSARAQSLFQRPAQSPPPAVEPVDPASPVMPPAPAAPASPDSPSVPVNADEQTTPPSAVAQPATAAAAPRSLREISLMAVIPPKPKQYRKHDKVEVIINESSSQDSSQKLETKKDASLSGELSQFPSLSALLTQLELRNGIGTPAPSIGAKGANEWKGDGKFERRDRFTARISAVVLEVKPNGMLLLEAREQITMNGELSTLVVSGLCDPKDITTANTVQSSQLANLILRSENSGDVNNAATKGPITRFFDAIFNF